MAGTSRPTAVTMDLSNVWMPYKELCSVVDAALVQKDPDAVPELEASLRLHKPDFVSLLKNPAKSPLHRTAVLHSPLDGIAVVGQSSPQILPQSIVDEALLLSDMFDLNELAALELLHAGQQQQQSFPGLTRGLVAVLLYFDGRRSVVSALRTLVQAREGRTWTLGLNREVVTIVTNYTDQLKEEGLIMKVLDALSSINLEDDLTLLQRNRALGSPRYRKQVTDMMQEIRQCLAEIVFCWACQGTLTKIEAMRLVGDLSKQQCTRGDGSLDSVCLTLLMALLYVMDVSYLQTAEEVDDRVHQLPVVADPDLARSLHKELLSATNWEIPGLKTILQFAWAITLHTLSQYSWSIQTAELSALLEDDERTVDTAIELGSFLSLQNLVTCSPTFHQEEFFIKRIHVLVTDFIIMMPLKVKDLRNRGDEMARIVAAHFHEGLQPPSNLPRHFEHFMGLISELYSKDDLDLELAFEYWCPSETTEEASWIARPPQRQVALYKFVRLAGDLLPAPLFVPYIRMLNSLSGSRACSHQCYTMLKINGKAPGSQSSIISWDHFFNSMHRYYTNLRCEVPPVTDYRHLYGQRTHPRGITPQEVEGLRAILQLLETVVKYDDMARIALWENSLYMPAVVLLGLVGCSVPSSIKASLLLALAAFARSPDITSNLWQSLEISQLIPTIKSVSTYQPAGIQMDLLDVESRSEEYPITRAALCLILELLSHPLPHNLGAGQRVPGLGPYLEYIEKIVFFPFHTRSYKNVAEKWEIGHLCSEIFVKLLEDYNIPKKGFATTDAMPNSHPGYTLMVQFLQDNTLLQLVLLVLDEGTKALDNYAVFSGQEFVEKCTLSSLKLLHQAVLRQEQFLEHIRNSSSSLLVTSFDRLLLGVNPRSGHPDHIVIIAKYVTYNPFLPEHTLVALEILEQLCQISQIAQHLVMAFSSEQKVKEMLVHGFVECLDAEECEGNDTQSSDKSQVRYECQQKVLKLILTCLNHPSPNLAHLLLGFQTQKPISQTVLQDPGILDSPRSCLHAVLTILNRGRASRGYPLAIYETPSLAELAYYLIYVLCSNKDTSQPTLRYLRTNHDFIYGHVQLLPFKQSGVTSSLLAQQSWLLKTLAVELRVIAVHHQRSHVQRLLKLLLEDSPESTNQTNEVDALTTPSFTTQPGFAGSVRRKLMCFLDVTEFGQTWPPMPPLEFLDPVEIERVMNQCESSSGTGTKLVNVTQLHQQVVKDLLALQGLTSLSQRPMLAQEVHSVLQYALTKNKARQTVYNKQQLFDAWRQVTEVLFTACPLSLMSAAQKQQVLLEIAQELLAKVREEGSLAELTAPASGVILILTTTLHHSLELEEVSSLFAFSSSLVVVLKGILECLIRSGGRFQRVRINYYGALLNLLQIVRAPKDSANVSRLDSVLLDRESETERLRREHMEVILNFGEGLMEIICRDACSGHDVTKMLALATLDVMMSLDSSHYWLSFLESKGYLRHIVDSLVADNLELQQILIRESESHRTLYVFESKLALLIKIARFTLGAQALMRNGIFVKLSECSCLDLRPERNLPSSPGNDLNQSGLKSFSQILTPVFQLVHSIVTTLGAKHCEVASQLQQFVSAHRELFGIILRDRANTQQQMAAEELAFATVTLSQLSLEDVPSGKLYLNPEQQSHLNILHRQLLAVLPKVVVALLSNPTRANDASLADTQLKVTLLQVATNVLSSCCFVISQTFLSQAELHYRILFLPNFIDVSTRERYYASGRDAGLTVSGARPPSLGLLVTLLQFGADQLRECGGSRHKLEQQLQSLQSLNPAEINEWLPPEMKSDRMTHQQRELAHLHMNRLLQTKTREVALHSYIIESSLFLLWRHLEYFLCHCIPDEIPTITLKVTQAELETLAAEMKTVINDSFFNKIQSAQQHFAKDHHRVDFVQALVRRTKRLIMLKSK